MALNLEELTEAVISVEEKRADDNNNVHTGSVKSSRGRGMHGIKLNRFYFTIGREQK